MLTLKLGRTLAILFLLTFAICFTAESAFSQCGTYLKTNYRKLVPGFADYNLDDWNNDNKLDFWAFVYNPSTTTQDVYVYLNTGSFDWNWSSPIVMPTTIPAFSGNGQDAVHLIDIDGDGDKDIFFIQQRTFHTVYKNNGNGTFTPSPMQLFSDGQVMETIGFLDVNNDGRLDWLQLTNEPGLGNALAYRLANTDGTFGAINNIILNGDALSSDRVLGDFNGDGKTDIAIVTALQYRLLSNNGTGGFTIGNPVSLPLRKTHFISVGDFNNDGKSDILVQISPDSAPNETVRRNFVYYGQANGTFNTTEYPASNATDYAGLKTAEVNGDGKLDFIEFFNNVSSASPSYTVSINDGSGGFTKTEYKREIGQINDYIFADIDHDGKTDFFKKFNYGSSYVSNLFGDQIITIQNSQCQSFGETKKPNFNGNYSTDLISWNPNTGVWSPFDGFTLNSVPFANVSWGSGSLGDIPAAGDFDGDGRTDYAVYRNGTGTWYINQSANSSWYVLKFGLPGDIPIPSDYDGGGKTDIAVFRPSDGNWYFWYMETQQFSAVHFGAGGDKPVAQDYDGDGKTDVAVFRPSEGNWYYLRSSDQNYAVIHWGISIDKPVPGDYDGDGKADLAVFRNGDWYILRSSNGAFYFTHLGSNGDIPLPHYYSSESTRPAVFRPSLGVWYSSTFSQNANFAGSFNYTPIYIGLPNI